MNAIVNMIFFECHFKEKRCFNLNIECIFLKASEQKKFIKITKNGQLFYKQKLIKLLH